MSVCVCVLVAGGSVAQAGARQDQGSLTAEGRVTGGGGGKEGSDQHPTDTLVPVTTDIFCCHFSVCVCVCVCVCVVGSKLLMQSSKKELKKF